MKILDPQLEQELREAQEELPIDVERPTILQTSPELDGGSYEPVLDTITINPEEITSKQTLKAELGHKNQWDSQIGPPSQWTEEIINDLFFGYDKLKSIAPNEDIPRFTEVKPQILYLIQEDDWRENKKFANSEDTEHYMSKIIKVAERIELPGLEPLNYRKIKYKDSNSPYDLRELESFLLISERLSDTGVDVESNYDLRDKNYPDNLPRIYEEAVNNDRILEGYESLIEQDTSVEDRLEYLERVKGRDVSRMKNSRNEF